MPRQKAAWKDLRKNQNRRQKNISIKSELKTLIKKVENFITAGKKAEALAAYKIFASKFDKAASDNIIHKNTASRKKSRLAKRLNKIS